MFTLNGFVISNTSADQYRGYAKHTKHYAVMPESIEDTDIQPQSYVIIDDIRVMNLKCGPQREALYKFFTMWIRSMCSSSARV